MGYSPFSADDSDLEDWVRQQAESGALDDLASPSPMAAFQPPPHAEMAPLKIDTGPDWSDALGAGTTALAALADLGLNHGRGTGQILAAGGQFGQARAEQRLKGTQEALNYEQKRAELERQNNYNDYLYANLAKRTGATGTTTAYQQSQLDARKATESRLEQERQDRIANSKAADEDRDAARTDREQQFQLSLEDRKLARESAEAERAGRAADRQQAQADRAAERKDAVDERAANKFRADTEYTRPQIDRAQNVNRLSEEGQANGDIPGVGKWDSIKGKIPLIGSLLLSDKDIEMQGNLSGMAETVLRDDTGAAATDPEVIRTAKRIGAGESISEKEFIVLQKGYNDVLKASLQQAAAGKEDIARGILGDQRANWAGIRAPSASPQAPAADSFGATNYGPDADHPSNLGVTGPPGVRNTPSFRATPGGGAATARGGQMGPVGGMASGSTSGGGVPMRTPSGNIGMVPPDRIQAAIAAGWKPAQ